MSHEFYGLFSEKSNKHYAGFSSDFETRFRSHNEFEKDWTAKCRPWIVILTETYLTKPEAIQRENWLKPGAGRTYIKLLNKN
ncbi:MAG: GIY-YIG nuclease family protein [Bacteroidetes bacterium]|nr:GIY-YIG nuclease family protein [Bacteroidota bacterium]